MHLFDWDEINFAEISREMLALGDYLRVHVNYQPFWEKPPFFFWLQALAMHLFGVGEFAARLPNALCGIASLVLLYRMGSWLHDARFGLFWALAYLGSILPHLYFRSGIIDPVFNLFIFGSLYLFLLFFWKKEGLPHLLLPRSQWTYLLLAGLSLGIAILTKGPVAYLIMCLTFFVYWVGERFRWFINPLHFLAFTVAASLVTLSWYGVETWHNGSWFISEFNCYQYRLLSTPDAGHSGFPGYHFVVLLVGCFPASIFALRQFFRRPLHATLAQLDFRRWMLILFWVVLLLFTLVRSKIVHYSSLCYFPLTYLAAVTLYELHQGEIRYRRYMQWGLFTVGGLFVLATIALPWLGRNIDLLRPLFANDPFAQANLDADVQWSGWQMLPGIWLLAVLLLAHRFFRQARVARAVYTLFLGTAVFLTLTLYFDINRIEAYSQGAAIAFYESKAQESCYIHTYGFKSYGHLFYARKPPVTDTTSYSLPWLLDHPVDRPVYIISKINKCADLTADPRLQEIERKNGFVMFQKR